jgi:hypothetical protein
VTEKLTCAIVQDQDLVARFVADRLPEAEVDRLEEHCLTCEECWSELRLALKISAAAHAEMEGLEPAVGPVVRTGSTIRYLPWLAVAATVLLAAGIFTWVRQPAEAVLERGAFNQIHVTANRTAAGGVRVEWPAIEGADRYTATVTTGSGRLVASREVTGTTTTFDSIRLVAGDVRPAISVEAFDALGNRLGKSDPIPVP